LIGHNKEGEKIMKLWILPEPSKYLPKIKKQGAKFGGYKSNKSYIVKELGAKSGQVLVNSDVVEKVTRYYRIKK